MISDYELAIRAAGIEYHEFLGGYYDIKLQLKALAKEYPTLQERAKALLEAEENDRFSFIRRFSFAIPDQESLAAIAKHTPILEVAAGTGYWAYELRKLGVDIIATDPKPPHTRKNRYKFVKEWVPIEKLSGKRSLLKYPHRTLLLCWPSYDEPWADELLQAYSGTKFLYLGEYRAACANDAFFDRLEKDWEEEAYVRIPQWFGIHDRLFIFTRK